jgi:Raf kinase inhibitor-like YbhB/YbcL family protein
MTRTATDLQLTSPAFKDGETIPRDYTADGRDVSPPLNWGDVPTETKSLALICEDPDAPKGLFTHWVVFNIRAESRGLMEDRSDTPTLRDGMEQGTNSFGKIGYGGPSPPPGKPHRYVFRLFALRDQLNLPNSTTRDELLAAMNDLILGEGELTGLYGRSS